MAGLKSGIWKIKMKSESKDIKADTVRYYRMEGVTIEGFCNFCKKNILLIITVSIALVFTYGIRLFWYFINNDTVRLFRNMANMPSVPGTTSGIFDNGRFGSYLMSRILFIRGFNPFTCFFGAFCLIWFFTVSWCYVIAIFSKDTVRNIKLIPFALVFMTMPIWAEQFSFLYQAEENALIISLCPYVVYFLFKGFLDNEKGKTIGAFILLVLMTSIYQAVVPLFCCGVFICFILLQEHSEYDPYVYQMLCLKIFITLIGSLALYSFINKIIPAIAGVDKDTTYIDDMNRWGNVSAFKNFLSIISMGYILTIGDIPLVQSIVNPIIAREHVGGIGAIEYFAILSRAYGNILLLPATVFFLIKIAINTRKTIPSGRRLLYMLAGIGIPLSIIILSIVLGNRQTIRTLYALPLAYAFMLYYLIRTYQKELRIGVTCLSLLTAVYQMETTAQLFFSDHMQYDDDVRFAYELNNLIKQVQNYNEKLPIVFCGLYQGVSRFQPNFLRGETIGVSSFGQGSNSLGTTIYALSFMNSLGIYFDMPDKNQAAQAFTEVALMPSYPDPDCARCMHDFIVVRISETLYENAYLYNTLNK
jgi:hypothetical protein